MVFLWETSPQWVSDLGKTRHLNSKTLMPLLQPMEKSGLVIRRIDNEDKRGPLILLTEQGNALRAPAAKVPLALQDATQCSNEELSELRD
jgi:DNA-binding MarR family transcriptional regulator